jgi:hypothetical protein
MSTSATELAYIRLSMEVPARLSNKAIDEAVAMAASHIKFLLGRRYRAQIRKRVSVRVAQSWCHETFGGLFGRCRRGCGCSWCSVSAEPSPGAVHFSAASGLLRRNLLPRQCFAHHRVGFKDGVSAVPPELLKRLKGNRYE